MIAFILFVAAIFMFISGLWGWAIVLLFLALLAAVAAP